VSKSNDNKENDRLRDSKRHHELRSVRHDVKRLLKEGRYEELDRVEETEKDLDDEWQSLER